jgi:hypothetical protein
MQLKNKLRFGIGFLLMVALIGSGLALDYLNNLPINSKAIVKNNYQFITRVKNIGRRIDQIYRSPITCPAPAISKGFTHARIGNICIESPVDNGSPSILRYPLIAKYLIPLIQNPSCLLI